MNPVAEMILEGGPRGRRCCLELAKDLDSDISTAVFQFAHGVEEVSGSSGVRLIPTAVGGTDPFPVSTLEQLSADLASVDLADLDTGRVQAALARSVDSAMYWQEPDGADVLAGHPTVRAALSRLAEHLASSPPIMEWFGGEPPSDRAVGYRVAISQRLGATAEGSATNTQTVGGRRAHGGSTGRARTPARPPHADWTGTWWSIPLGLIKTVGRLPAELSLVEDGFGWQQATAIPVHGRGRTFEVRSEEDWILLCRSFPLEVTASRRHNWFRATGRDGRWVIPDWERVASAWDAVHLTPLCYLSSATRALQVDTETASVIAGWDPRQHHLAHRCRTRRGRTAAGLAPRQQQRHLDFDVIDASCRHSLQGWLADPIRPSAMDCPPGDSDGGVRGLRHAGIQRVSIPDCPPTSAAGGECFAEAGGVLGCVRCSPCRCRSGRRRRRGV